MALSFMDGQRVSELKLRGSVITTELPARIGEFHARLALKLDFDIARAALHRLGLVAAGLITPMSPFAT